MDKNILIADDNMEIIKILRPYTEKEGFKVIFALDGEEALLKFKHYNPELILLDIMMPLMDGIEVCNIIRGCSKFA